MIVYQEIWCISRGRYTTRKALTVYYNVAKGIGK